MCLLGPLAFQVFSQGGQESSIVIGCLTNLNGHRTHMATGLEVPPDSSGAPLSVGEFKSSAVSESERCAWCQLVCRHRPLCSSPAFECPCTELESPSATSIYILLTACQGFCSSLPLYSNDQSQACSSSLSSHLRGGL